MTDRHDDPDAEPTAEELAEAEALARGLSPEVREIAPGPPAGLDAALLVRHSRDGGALAQERAEVVLARVERDRARRQLRLRILVPGVALAAAAAVALAFFTTREPAPNPAVALPAPSAELLRAQVGAASGEGIDELDQAMRRYRGDVYSALAQRYGVDEP